jgi:ATP-dependent exoDNAse (exonuclease V) beta subunit
MTIHKAKGLEFDHVILPSLHKSPKSNDNPLLRWQEQVDEQNQSFLLLAALGPYDEENDPIYSYLKYEQSTRTILENTRVLYVAATRAVRKLHLFAKIKEAKDDWQKPSKTSLLSSIWPSLNPLIGQPGYQVTNIGDNNKEKEAIASVNYYRRLPLQFNPVIMPKDMMTLGVSNQYSSATKSDSLDFRARHLGTTLHRTLKQIACDGIEQWPLERRKTLDQGWKSTLNQLGILVTAEEISILKQSIETMLNDTRGKWILGKHIDANCEQALSYFDKHSQSIKTSVIDRTFIDEDKRWIIDYKYAAPNINETEQNFYQRQIETYSPQLNHYAQLYQKLETKKVRCALYFPQTAVFIEVTGD